MALTLLTQYAAPRAVVAGNSVLAVQDIQFDASYPTGGYSLTPTQLGLYEVIYLDGSSVSGYVPHYDYANQKLKLYSASGTEVTNATNLSTVFCRIIAIGHGYATQGLK